MHSRSVSCSPDDFRIKVKEDFSDTNMTQHCESATPPTMNFNDVTPQINTEHFSTTLDSQQYQSGSVLQNNDLHILKPVKGNLSQVSNVNIKSMPTLELSSMSELDSDFKSVDSSDSDEDTMLANVDDLCIPEPRMTPEQCFQKVVVKHEKHGSFLYAFTSRRYVVFNCSDYSLHVSESDDVINCVKNS